MKKEDLGSIILPRFIQPHVKKVWRTFQRWKVNNLSSNISKGEIVKGLRKLGLKKGMLVWVHCSLSSFGFVEGGPETVVLALKEAVGKDGTIAMPSFPGHGGEKKYLSTDPVFDFKSTSSKTGKVSDFFWKMPETLRSKHPTHSVAASGPLAIDIISDHEYSSSEFGNDTPFGKLFSMNSEIVFLGVGIEKLSLYHHIEDVDSNFPYNVYLDDTFPAKWIDNDGKVQVKNVRVHDTELSKYRIETPNGRKIRKIFLEELSKKNRLRKNKIGSANCLMFSTRSLTQVSDSLLKSGKTIYNIPTNREYMFLKKGA